MNRQLYDHITRLGFNLSCTKTQIAVLVYLDLLKRDVIVETSYKSREEQRLNAYSRMIDSNFVLGVSGLRNRGLVTHHHDGHKHRDDDPLLMFYTVTKAGEAVIIILKESGLYEQYATALAGVFRKVDA